MDTCSGQATYQFIVIIHNIVCVIVLDTVNTKTILVVLLMIYRCAITVCANKDTVRSTAVGFLQHHLLVDQYTASAEYPQWWSQRVS